MKEAQDFIRQMAEEGIDVVICSDGAHKFPSAKDASDIEVFEYYYATYSAGTDPYEFMISVMELA